MWHIHDSSPIKLLYPNGNAYNSLSVTGVFLTFEKVQGEKEQQSVLNDLIHPNDDACSVQTELTTKAIGVHGVSAFTFLLCLLVWMLQLKGSDFLLDLLRLRGKLRSSCSVQRQGLKRWAFWKHKRYDKEVKRVCGLLRRMDLLKGVKIDTLLWWKSDFGRQTVDDVSGFLNSRRKINEWKTKKANQTE